ncbi:MAG: aromatic amino acid lyase [Myxococcales bacterium]|nr:MAG: aromatic amino acid lyase [Myxococcales bacterium]
MSTRKSTEPVVLTGANLTVDEVARVARRDAKVEIASEAMQAVRDSESALRSVMSQGKKLYGLTTGVGALDRNAITPDMNRVAQINLIRSHAAGVGAAMPSDQVRANAYAIKYALCWP